MLIRGYRSEAKYWKDAFSCGLRPIKYKLEKI